MKILATSCYWKPDPKASPNPTFSRFGNLDLSKTCVIRSISLNISECLISTLSTKELDFHFLIRMAGANCAKTSQIYQNDRPTWKDGFFFKFFFFFFFFKKKKKKIRDVNDSIQDFEVVMRNKKPGIVPKIVELGIILIILPKYSNKINIK